MSEPSSALSPGELADLGLRVGRRCRISRDARFFGADRITLGDNVRIDSFCVLSAGETGHIRIGNHCHVSAGARMFGQGTITIGDLTAVSVGTTLLSASDDFSGDHLFGPVVDAAYTAVDARPLVLGAYTLLGAHGVVFPGVHVGEGAVLGAGGVATGDLDPWTINVGVPARLLKPRRRGLLAQAEKFLADWDAEWGRA